jgi:hypothetical protein
MGWEIYTRTTQMRETQPTVNISKLGRIGLNRATAQLLKKNFTERVLLMFDRESNRIALRPITKKDPSAYSVLYGRKDAYASVAGKGFFLFIGYDLSKGRTFPAKWNEKDNILEVEIPSECLKDKAQSQSNIAELKQKRG